jgi:hypothetical protein
MNERIQELAKQAGLEMCKCGCDMLTRQSAKFAELIVRECADTIENRAPGQMGKEGEGWTNGYDDGLKTGAFLIKKHFGVEK